MSKAPLIGIVQFPGTNCERETAQALTRVGCESVDVLWNSDEKLIDQCQGFVIAGGFSYEDRISSGVIASLSPIMQRLKQQANLGKPILGICNGAQILVASGLVPGINGGMVGAALTHNKRVEAGKELRHTYYNDWCDVQPLSVSSTHAFTNQFKVGQSIHIPFAHAEGRFVLPEALFQRMKESDAQLFQYTDANPNGSNHALAALSNRAGNVMAMMPHPERTENGDLIFKSMKHYIENTPCSNFDEAFDFDLEKPVVDTYQPAVSSHPLLVSLVIEDNSARSLQLALSQQEIAVSVKRYRFLELNCAESLTELKPKLKQTTAIYNDSKELLTSTPIGKLTYLIVKKDDTAKARLQESLKRQLQLDALAVETAGVVFSFDGSDAMISRLQAFLSEHYLLFNPFVEDCYEYGSE